MKNSLLKMENKKYFLRGNNNINTIEQQQKITDNNLLNKKRKCPAKTIEHSSLSNKFHYKSHLTSFEILNDDNINNQPTTNQNKKKTFDITKCNDLIEGLKIIMVEKKLSEIYKKKAIHIIETFINYLKKIDEKKQDILPKNNYNKCKIRRIKMKDISGFVESYKGYKSLKTKYNVSCLLRRLARIFNEEPKLNFKKKISFPKEKKVIPEINTNILFKIASNFREEKDLENLILLYLAYFCGLNFYMIARILIKDLKSSFKTLIIKKGGKKRVHKIYNIIINLLFEYFTKSRTYESKYFFFDDFKGKKGISRAQYIKNKFKESITKQKIINNEEIEKIISSFSKLRRAKVFSERDYYLFDLSLSGMLNNKFFNENACISEESSKKYIYNNNKKETKNLIEDDFSNLMISENLKKHTIKKK